MGYLPLSKAFRELAADEWICETSAMADPDVLRELASPLASAALDVVDNMLVITDRSGRIVYVNPAFTRVTGYTNDEALGQNPRLLHSGIQDEAFYEQLWARILAGRTWSGELVNRKKSGELYTDRMTVTPLRDEAGEISHFVAVKRDESDHLAALTAGSPGGIAHTDRTGRLVYANRRLSTLLGRGFDELLGSGWLEALGKPAADQVLADLASVTVGADLVSTVELGDGRSFRVHYAPLLLGGDGQAGVVTTLEDVTVERDALRRVEEREVYARGILESLGTPTAVVDGAGVIREVNRAWRDNAGAAGAGLVTVGVGVDYREVCRRSQAAGCGDAGLVLDALDRVLAGESELETLDYSMDGPRMTWWELRISALELEAGGAVLTHTDVTWRHEVQRLLEDQARTDPLTGLTNRLGLLTFGEGAMARARRTEHPVTVLFIDLDAFKPINDQYGHQAGDEVLKACARRLQWVLRETDGIARIGGDEFVIVCEDLDEADVGPMETRIEQSLAESIDLGDGTEVAVAASIGTIRIDDSADLAQAIENADAKMYDAKRRKQSEP